MADKNKDKNSEDFEINENIYKNQFEDDFEDEDFTVKEASQKTLKESSKLKKQKDDYEESEEFIDEKKDKIKVEQEEDDDDEFDDEDENEENDIDKKKQRPDQIKNDKRKPITIRPVTEIKKKKFIKVKKIKRKEPNQERSNKSNSNWIWVVLIIVAIAVIAFVVYKLNQGATPNTNNLKNDSLAALVNGEPVYMNEIDTKFNSIAPVLQQIYTKEFILNQTIDEILLVQDAKKNNIKITDDQVNEEINKLMTENNLTTESLDLALQQQGLSLAYLKDAFTKKLYVDELVKLITVDIKITDDEIQNYYKNYSKFFVQEENVTVSHILIGVNPELNKTDAVAKKLAEDVYKKIRADKTNFCDLVLEYSEDPGSKANCGEYTFGRGMMVAEFENASFSTAINKSVIVKTSFGYHILWVKAKNPSKQLTLAEVKDRISEILLADKQAIIFRDYIVGLREKSEIVNYLENPNAPDMQINQPSDQTNDNVIEIKDDKTNTIELNNTVKDSENMQTGSVVEDVVKTNESKSTSNTNDNTATEVVVTPDETKTTVYADMALINCLNDKGAKLYGVYWKKESRDQLAIFGDEKSKINYIECDANMQNNKAQECKNQEISSYPSWIIDGKKYSGLKSVDELKAIADC